MSGCFSEGPWSAYGRYNVLRVDEHSTSITSSCLSSLSQTNRVKHLLDRNTLFNIINALVVSKLVRPSGLVQQRRISTNYRMSKTSQLGL